MSEPKERLAKEWWWLLITSCAALALLIGFQATVRLDFILYDLLQSRFYRSVDSSVIIVAIDNDSVAEHGPWPWPRERIARLVDEIAKAKPEAIGVDILFLGRRFGKEDAELARSLRSEVPVYLPLQFDIPGHNGAEFEVTRPIPQIMEQAASLGHVVIVPDRDGLVRRAYLTYSAGSVSWPSLAALLSGRAPPESASRTDLPDRGRKLIGRDPVLISFAGPAGTFPMVSASSVLKGEIPSQLFLGRRVLIGVTANGIGDFYATSVGFDGSLMPGVEVQANLLNTLATDPAFKPADAFATFLLSLIPVLVVMAALRYQPPRSTLALVVCLLIVILFAVVGALQFLSYWIPPFSVIAVIVALYPVWTWRKLSLASSFMSKELERFARESGLLERADHVELPVDMLDRQMQLLSKSIRRERDLRKFLNDLLSQMPDCILVANLEGSLMFMNENAKRLAKQFGREHIPIIADDILNYLYVLKPEGRSPIRFSSVPKTSITSWNCESEAANGRSFDICFQPQKNSNQILVGYVIKLVESTEFVTAQRQRNDALGLLSHDMRAPQSSIISYVDSLGSDKIVPEVATRIRYYAAHTLKLADDFVHLSRAQMIEVKFEKINIASLLVEASQLLWPQAAAKRIRFEHIGAEEELWVEGDASLLRRMLCNLIDNAIKFSREAATVSLVCRLFDRGLIDGNGSQWARLAVVNEGDGMPSARVADLYRRFQSSSPLGAFGAGMGLAFVHTVVSKHRGRLRCESIEGQQTTFTIELPAIVSQDDLAALTLAE